MTACILDLADRYHPVLETFNFHATFSVRVRGDHAVRNDERSSDFRQFMRT
jgi:hypothetical protein